MSSSRTARWILAAVAAAGAYAPAWAAELPDRTPGLWETRALIDGRYRVVRRCFKQGERSAFIDAVGVGACSASAQKTIFGGWMMQADCRTPKALLSGKLLVSGDFGAELQGRVVTSVTPAAGGPVVKRTAMTFSSRRLGECATTPRG
ncbi:DUF3617 domain-containing protein [Hansschlegelia zhihuaiae]|uniref:DUF3617 family protein n=1 Tax=Hansschlegelia zhihuaiae TaxID=405005 RepID=A0A4Q0MKT5_9HYPH|nr:DUF3617 family protein [Hansschlegelia zhihuaiae]RXF74063.1 hypothetical protein EK403_06735 [Hansschlegelia zhihuaiae]